MAAEENGDADEVQQEENGPEVAEDVPETEWEQPPIAILPLGTGERSTHDANR